MKSAKLLSLLMAGLLLSLPQVSYADRGGRDRHYSPPRHYVHRDHGLWWWWVPPLVLLSTLPAHRDPPPPVIIQQSPPVVVPSPAPMTAMPSPPPYWYFCPAANTYYPYVQDCPGGWNLVPATPPSPAN